MPSTVQRVQPRLAFVPPDFKVWVLRLVHAFVPILLRFRTRPWLTAGIRRVEVIHPETLANLYQKFQAGSIRFMIAFRHVEVDDPLCGLQLLSRVVPQAARQQGIVLKTPLHAHFVYERGMPLWAGDWLKWLFAKLGGIPVRRGRRPDWTGLRAAREMLVHGGMPLAIAPEGATNGHSDRVGPCEPGSAQLAFWGVEDLTKANRSERVYVVPVGIQYRYVDAPWANLATLLTQLEQDCGLHPLPIHTDSDDPMVLYYPRLLRLGEHLISRMEVFYSRFYHHSFAPLDDEIKEIEEIDGKTDPGCRLSRRLNILLDHALREAETYFGVTPQGNVVDRCRRLEEAGWTYIYRDDIEDYRTLPPLDRGLADWIAQEASLRLLHMRLAESFVAVTGNYVKEKPTIERFAETALLMFDMTARLRGDKLPKRPRLGDRWVKMTIGDPISVSDRWPDYKANRRMAIAHLTEDLKTALEKMID